METAGATTFSITTFKNFLYIPAFLLGLSLESMSILAIFMMLDTVLGVVKSMVLHGPRSFTSRILAHGLVSKLLVLLVPLIVVWSGRGAGFDLHMLASGVISILVLSEAYSILGHIQSIRTGEEVKEFDAVSLVLKSVREVLEKMLTTKTTKQK